MLAVIAWAGVALAEPTRPAPPSTPAIVPADDETWLTGGDDVGEYIRQLERHLDWMHSRAERRKDSETLAEVDAIQKKLAVAKENHRVLCRLCAEQLHDTPLARACCQKIDDVMHEVIDDHLALMRRLRARRSRPPSRQSLIDVGHPPTDRRWLSRRFQPELTCPSFQRARHGGSS